MDVVENDEVLSVTDWPSDRHEDNPRRRFSHRNRSVTISIPVSSSELTSDATSLVDFTGPLHSGRKTPDIQMTSSRSYATQRQGNPSRSIPGALGMERKDPDQLHDGLYGDAKGWAGKKLPRLKQHTFGVLNPHAKVDRQWNQFFINSCFLTIFIDPLFCYILSVKKNQKCIAINWPMTQIIVVLRCMTDVIYLMNLLVQFRLAFIAPESRDVGAGELVDHPKSIVRHCLSKSFFLDLLVVLPLPQIVVLFVLPNNVAANHATNLLLSVILVQYIARLYRCPALTGQFQSGSITESLWLNCAVALMTFASSGHVFGSLWYLFGLQRVSQCFGDACHKSGIVNCMKFIDCGHGIDFTSFELEQTWNNWKQNENSSACFKEDGFPYGIYVKAVNLTAENSIITRYIYSFFWGFQQISTLAGNQTPSYSVGEVVFTLGIIGLGLIFFAIAFGNLQSFFQGLGRRQLEMATRRRDIEQWMDRRCFPKDLRRQVRESERYNWAATKGVNEEMLMESLPEDLQSYIRRNLFWFVKKVRIFALLDEPILEAICEKLRQTRYIRGGRILNQGELVMKMVFIVRGRMESMGEDGNIVQLSKGDVCGEELLTWCLDYSSDSGDIGNHGKPAHMISNRTVKCLTNVEALVLRVVDLEEVASRFAGSLRNHRIQTAVRNESPYWRARAAICIQVAWRCRKKRLTRENNPEGNIALP